MNEEADVRAPPGKTLPRQRRRSEHVMVLVSDLSSDMPITEREQQLVSCYLGDLIKRILIEPS